MKRLLPVALLLLFLASAGRGSGLVTVPAISEDATRY